MNENINDTKENRKKLLDVKNELNELLQEWRDYFNRHPDPHPSFKQQMDLEVNSLKKERDRLIKLIGQDPYEFINFPGVKRSFQPLVENEHISHPEVNLDVFLANVEKELNLAKTSLNFPSNVATESPVAIQPPALPVIHQTSEPYPSNLPITDDFWPTEPVATIEPIEIPTPPLTPVQSITTIIAAPTQSTSSAIRIIDLDPSTVETVVTNILKSGCVPSNPDWDISTDIGFELCQESIAYIKSVESEHPYLWLPDEEEHGFSKRIKCFDLLNVCFAFFKQLVLDPEYVRQNKECQERGDYEFTTRAFAAGIPSSIKCTSLNQLIPALIIDANTYRGIDASIPKWEMAKYEKRAEKFKSVKIKTSNSSSEPKVDGRFREKKDTSEIEASRKQWKDDIEEATKFKKEIAKVKLSHEIKIDEMNEILSELEAKKKESKARFNEVKLKYS